MRTPSAGLALPFLIVAALVAGACSEPTKPIKKLNIKRASDMEPISAPAATATDAALPAETTDTGQEMAPSAEIEVVDVDGFRGACDSSFVGINDDGLVTVMTASQVRTYRLAGVSIPAAIMPEAQNQVRIWLNKKRLSVEIDESVPSLDAAVYVYACPEGTMINEELVRAGLAVPSESRFRRTDELKRASIEALSNARGVWGRKPQ